MPFWYEMADVEQRWVVKKLILGYNNVVYFGKVGIHIIP